MMIMIIAMIIMIVMMVILMNVMKKMTKTTYKYYDFSAKMYQCPKVSNFFQRMSSLMLIFHRLLSLVPILVAEGPQLALPHYNWVPISNFVGPH